MDVGEAGAAAEQTTHTNTHMRATKIQSIKLRHNAKGSPCTDSGSGDVCAVLAVCVPLPRAVQRSAGTQAQVGVLDCPRESCCWHPGASARAGPFDRRRWCLVCVWCAGDGAVVGVPGVRLQLQRTERVGVLPPRPRPLPFGRVQRLCRRCMWLLWQLRYCIDAALCGSSTPPHRLSVACRVFVLVVVGRCVPEHGSTGSAACRDGRKPFVTPGDFLLAKPAGHG